MSAGLCTRTVVPSVRRARYSTLGAVAIERNVELALQPLTDYVHVEQAEEATAEAEPERHRALWGVRDRGVAQPQLFQRFPQSLELVPVGRVKPAEHHRFGLLVTRQRGLGGPGGLCDGLAAASFPDVLYPSDEVADLAWAKGLGLSRGGQAVHPVPRLRGPARSA